MLTTQKKKLYVRSSMRSLLLFIVGSICLPSALQAQVFLTLEGYNAKRVVEYVIGDPIHYKLSGDKHWNLAVITGLHPETGTVFFEHGSINIEDVSGLRKVGKKQTPQKLSNALLLFGAQWIGYAAIADAADIYTMTTRDVIIGGGAATSGGILRLFAGRRKFKVGGSKKLRIRDLRWQMKS